MTHLAYNTATGEILTTNRANHLKRWVKRHTESDRKWYAEQGKELPPLPLGIRSRRQLHRLHCQTDGKSNLGAALSCSLFIRPDARAFIICLQINSSKTIDKTPGM